MTRLIPMKPKHAIIGALALFGAYAVFNLERYEQRKMRIGAYQGYKVEAFKDGDYKRVIIFPEGKPERIIGRDFPGGEEFESIDSLFLSADNPLRELKTPKHIKAAWDSLWEK